MIVSQDLITQGKHRRKIGFKSITLCNKTENGSPGMWCGEKCKANTEVNQNWNLCLCDGVLYCTSACIRDS